MFTKVKFYVLFIQQELIKKLLSADYCARPGDTGTKMKCSLPSKSLDSVEGRATCKQISKHKIYKKGFLGRDQDVLLVRSDKWAQKENKGC